MQQFDFDMEVDQYVDVHFRLSVSRINHLLCLINAWSHTALEYDRGPIETIVRQWRPGDFHPLLEDNPGAQVDHGNDGNDHGHGGGGGGNLGGDDPGYDSGSGDDDDPGGGNVLPVGVVNANLPPAGVTNGNPPPGVYGEDDFENDDDDDGHPATGIIFSFDHFIIQYRDNV